MTTETELMTLLMIAQQARWFEFEPIRDRDSDGCRDLNEDFDDDEDGIFDVNDLSKRTSGVGLNELTDIESDGVPTSTVMATALSTKPTTVR